MHMHRVLLQILGFGLISGLPSSEIKVAIARDDSLSNSKDSARASQDTEEPRPCDYPLTLENYTTIGRTCDLCKPNNTNQCPLPSGTTSKYQFVVRNPGTRNLHHSHIGVQKTDGQYGSLIVRDPPSISSRIELYDVDFLEHIIIIGDWVDELSHEHFPGRYQNNREQVRNNVLINGNVHWKDPTTNRTTSVQLKLFPFEIGKRYRFRLTNSFGFACPTPMTIEGHSLTLIPQDGKSVVPVPINTIVSFSGEGVDFILTANQTADAYWVRAIGECN